MMEPYKEITDPLVKEMSSDEEKYFNIPTYRTIEDLRNIIEINISQGYDSILNNLKCCTIFICYLSL